MALSVKARKTERSPERGGRTKIGNLEDYKSYRVKAGIPDRGSPHRTEDMEGIGPKRAITSKSDFISCPTCGNVTTAPKANAKNKAVKGNMGD